MGTLTTHTPSLLRFEGQRKVRLVNSFLVNFFPETTVNVLVMFHNGVEFTL